MDVLHLISLAFVIGRPDGVEQTELEASVQLQTQNNAADLLKTLLKYLNTPDTRRMIYCSVLSLLEDEFIRNQTGFQATGLQILNLIVSEVFLDWRLDDFAQCGFIEIYRGCLSFSKRGPLLPLWVETILLHLPHFKTHFHLASLPFIQSCCATLCDFASHIIKGFPQKSTVSFTISFQTEILAILHCLREYVHACIIEGKATIEDRLQCISSIYITLYVLIKSLHGRLSADDIISKIGLILKDLTVECPVIFV